MSLILENTHKGLGVTGYDFCNWLWNGLEKSKCAHARTYLQSKGEEADDKANSQIILNW